MEVVVGLEDFSALPWGGYYVQELSEAKGNKFQATQLLAA